MNIFLSLNSFFCALLCANCLTAEGLPEFNEENFIIDQIITTSLAGHSKALVHSDGNVFICYLSEWDDSSHLLLHACLPVLTTTSIEHVEYARLQSGTAVQRAADEAMAAAMQAVTEQIARDEAEAKRIKVLGPFRDVGDEEFAAAFLRFFVAHDCVVSVGGASFNDAVALRGIWNELGINSEPTDQFLEEVRKLSMRAFGRLFAQKKARLVKDVISLDLEDCK